MMTRDDVYKLCLKHAPDFQLNPLLVLAVATQESSYKEDEQRLENGFYRKYERPLQYSSVVEGLLSHSWGLMQMMGESLRVIEFFRWHYSMVARPGLPFNDPMQNLHVAYALDEYMCHPEWHIHTGCEWLRTKIDEAGGNTVRGLLRWNGGGDPDYPNKIVQHFNQLKRVYA